jgi:hypothetical protein
MADGEKIKRPHGELNMAAAFLLRCDSTIVLNTFRVW